VPDADLSECHALIARLRRLLREANAKRGADEQLGLSLGTATFPVEATGPRGLLAQADEAMYRDKRRQKLDAATAP